MIRRRQTQRGGKNSKINRNENLRARRTFGCERKHESLIVVYFMGLFCALGSQKVVSKQEEREIFKFINKGLKSIAGGLVIVAMSLNVQTFNDCKIHRGKFRTMKIKSILEDTTKTSLRGTD